MQAEAPGEWKVGATLVVKATPGLPFNVLGAFPDVDQGG